MSAFWWVCEKNTHTHIPHILYWLIEWLRNLSPESGSEMWCILPRKWAVPFYAVRLEKERLLKPEQIMQKYTDVYRNYGFYFDILVLNSSILLLLLFERTPIVHPGRLVTGPDASWLIILHKMSLRTWSIKAANTSNFNTTSLTWYICSILYFLSILRERTLRETIQFICINLHKVFVMNSLW